jgi:magnesium chelatase subunit D
MLPPAEAPRRMPAQIGDGRLLGGLDLAATLRAGRPIAERGLLAEADGGTVLVAMAERLPAGTAARLGAVLDSGTVTLQRDGLAQRLPARIGVVAFDEGAAEDERAPAALADRLALHILLDPIGRAQATAAGPSRAAIQAARMRLAGVSVEEATLTALCGTALALGALSFRASLLALRVACAAAALAGHGSVTQEDAALAARLVLSPRATRLPATEAAPAEQSPPQKPESDGSAPPDESGNDKNDDDAMVSDQPPDALVLAAAAAAIPAGLLAALSQRGNAARSAAAGRAGQQVKAARRGRPFGVRPGEPRGGNRLSVIETLRAAAPWQVFRRREAAAQTIPGPTPRIAVRREDFRILRFRHRSETVTIFVVDASGSAALQRLAEAKGAVELLLADCYVRRDRVALLAFRGTTAELLLPPTGALVRARRCLAGLPGGGGTPVAAAVDAAAQLAHALRRKGLTPNVVLLTDGRANIARDGTPGRAQAEADALAAARRFQADGFAALVLDTAPRPSPQAERLAAALGARYRPLPYADAGRLSAAVREGAG